MLHLITLFILYIPLVLGADVVGCYSSVGGKEYGSYQYQSPSYCADKCPDSPYIAVKGGDTCYCLDSKPSSSDETDDSSCNVGCFGFGSDKCGGSNSYSVFVGKGTSSDDGDDTQSSSTQQTTSSSSSTTEQKSSTAEPSTTASSSSSSSTSTSSSSTSTESSTITDAPKSSSDDARVITTSTSNSQGSVVIRTVTRDAEPTASSTSPSKDDKEDKNSNKSTGPNTGAIIGGVVGGVAGLVILAALAFFFIRHRRQQEEDDDEEEYFDKPGMGGSINRGYGTGKSKKSGKSNGLDMPMTNPFTHPSDNAPPGDLVDPRLNPIMLGRRRLSEGSLADETDYSRKILQVANPDST